MIQVHLETRAFEGEWCDGRKGFTYTVKIVRAKTYTKIVIYNTSEDFMGYYEWYGEKHDEWGNHIKYRKYDNGIEYKKKIKKGG